MATLVPVQRVLIPYPRRGRAGEPDSIRNMGGPEKNNSWWGGNSRAIIL